MSEHLRYLVAARLHRRLLHAQRRPARLTADGACYPLTPERARRRARRVHRASSAWPSSAAAAAPRPSTCGGRRPAYGGRERRRPRRRSREPGVAVALPARAVPPGHRRTCRSASAPTPTAPRRSARRCSRALGRLRRDRPRPDPRRRAPARRVRRLRRPRRRRRHARDGRPVRDRRRPCRWCSTRPSPPVIEAGLELLGGRAVVNSVNYEDGDGPGLAVRADHAARQRARRRRRRADHRRGGPGPHRRVEGRGSPTGSSTTSPATGGCASSDIIVDCLTFPIATGQEETRRDAHRDHRGDPRAQAAATRRSRRRSASPTSRSG